MASAKDDASTDIESLVTKFAKEMTSECASLRKARIDKLKKDAEAAEKKGDKKDDKKKNDKKPDDPPLITFALDPSATTKSRTPAEQAEQAEQVAAGKSWVCWGAHMADSARHVVMKADGKITWEPKKVMGDDWDAFKKAWGSEMKSCSLKNANGGDGWYDGDAFHLEMAESKISKTDERVKACLEEYAKLTRKDGKKQNDKFEKDYASLLKSYIEKYEKKDDKKAADKKK